MLLSAGHRLGHYEIVAAIGVGGMGEVYKARDTRLDRVVAIKVSKEQFSERFEREARLIASLNHPNICTLYDVGPNYLVMEYIEGSPFKGPLPVAKAVGYAIEILNALEAAHSKGIIHRDLKPANILITADRVKLLDFGLAKVDRSTPEPTDETRTMDLTRAGAVMGTPGFMAPEQWEGRRADARADIYAFGCVLYEMLTGRRVSAGRNSVKSAKLEQVLQKCLATNPGERWQSAAEVRAQLERVLFRPGWKYIAAAAAVLALAAIGLTSWWLSADKAAAPPARDKWVQLTNFPDSVSQPALSPDGRMLTFVHGPETFSGPGQIYFKQLPDGEPVQLTQDNLDKMSPVFSPDGSRIAYTARQRDTWVVPVVNAQPRLWLENASGLVWLDPQKLLFSEYKQGLHMGIVTAGDARAGERDVYLPASNRGMAHRSYPSPDKKSILLVEMERGAWLPCRLAPLDGTSPGRPVGPPDARCTFAAWSPDGKWMYFSSSAGGSFHIWRQRFPDGQPQQITAGPGEEEGIAMAADGHSFITAAAQRQSVVLMHDANGEKQISLEGYSFDPKITPDGKRLCYRILKGGLTTYDPGELRIVDIETGNNQPLLPGLEVFGPPGRAYEISPDGRRVVAAVKDREGKAQIWLAALDRQSPPTEIPNVEGDGPLFGKNGEIYFRKIESKTSAHIYRVKEDGGGLQRVSEQAISLPAGISQDGRWLIVRAVGPPSDTVAALPLDGASAETVLFQRGNSDHLAWSSDGKLLFVSAPTSATATHVVGRTYVVPLPPGQMFPKAPPGGFESAAELAELPGVRIIDTFDASPGLTPEVYVYSRASAQRNLYRVPVP